MSILKIKNPVEYSFCIWIRNHPDSPHWCDKERFLVFVKTVCRYRASKWKKIGYLKTRILKHHPNFENDYLQYILRLFDELVDFYEATPISSSFEITDRVVKKGHYLEIYAKDCAIFEKEIPFKDKRSFT